MALVFTNTLGRRKEKFVPLKGKHVRMYTCGPTVYDYAHIGNFRAYVFEDILRRYLKYRGFKVTQVMNITDVDDKTIRGSRSEGIPLKEYTDRYIRIFFEDLDSLGIERAEHYPRATEHIEDMIALIKRLKEKGYAYESENSIYYDISKFPRYGALSGIKVHALKVGARIRADEYAKDEARDFALWKGWDPEDGDVFWETEFGKGRPGWHIECSAMSMKYLGESFDLHTGGEDNIFPHHENEIAQSEAATGKKFVKYWLHCALLLVNGQKMSKSLGNYYTVHDLIKQGHNPRAIRYLLISAHYRAPLNFTMDALRNAETTVMRLSDFVSRLEQLDPKGKFNRSLHRAVKAAKKKFEMAMDDDLNTPEALAAIFELIHKANKAISSDKLSIRNKRELLAFIYSVDKVLGIFAQPTLTLPSEIEAMIKQREEARSRKDWETADRIREALREKGILLEDTPSGVRWRRVSQIAQ
jgi:cysteinyl-tRNA synthetase